MADKLLFIKRLRPIGMKFEPYGKNPLEIKMAPKLWSSHRYNTVKGYHYKINLISSDSILIKLEDICAKSCIIFNEVNLSLKDFTEMLFTAFKQDKNFITVTVNISYNLSKCDTCIRETRACKNLSYSKVESADLNIYFDRDDISKALDYYENSDNYKTFDDKTVIPVSSYNQTEKETKTMEKNQMSNFLGIECGVIENPNIAATALGICFRNEAGNWIKFDTKTQQRVDMGNIQLGNLGPLYLIPSRTVDVGFPIMYENEFYYVMDTSELPKLKLLSIPEGIEKTVYPKTNLLGISFFTKVVALIDADNLLGGDSDDMLTVLALTGGLGGNGNIATTGQNQQMNPLLLLALAKGGEDSPLGSLTNGGLLSGLGGDSDNSLQKLLPLIALGGLGGNSQANGGFDLNSLVLLSALGGKNKTESKKAETPKKTAKTAPKKKGSKTAKEKPEAPKEPETVTPEYIAKVVAETIASLKAQDASDTKTTTDK